MSGNLPRPDLLSSFLRRVLLAQSGPGGSILRVPEGPPDKMSRRGGIDATQPM